MRGPDNPRGPEKPYEERFRDVVSSIEDNHPNAKEKLEDVLSSVSIPDDILNEFLKEEVVAAVTLVKNKKVAEFLLAEYRTDLPEDDIEELEEIAR